MGQDPRTPNGAILRVDYVPRPGLLGLTLLNLLLNILTLTIYRFWAKTNVRRHIWSCVHINGEALEYTGRGRELFLGALIVFLVFVLPALVLVIYVQMAFGPEHPALALIQLIIFLVVFVLWGMAVYRARRYQLSRTLWRGIRGALVGSSWTYTWLHAGSWILKAMTLGWSTPAMNLNLQTRMIGDMYFGSMPFRFSGEAGPLYPRYAVAWFLALFTFLAVIVVAATILFMLFAADIELLFSELGSENPSNETKVPEGSIIKFVFGVIAALILAWLAQTLVWPIYVAREIALFASYTTLDRARFRLDATAGSLLLLTVGNVLLWIFTLGIATPFIQQRTIKYACDRLSITGLVDLVAIAQSSAPLPKSGEGLADAFDIGGI